VNWVKINMNTERNNIPAFDDIIFECRNKEYGAYVLRKKYNAVIIGGILVAAIVCSLAVIIPFVLGRSSEHIISGGSRFVQASMQNLEPPREQIYIPPAPPKPPKSIQDAVEYIPPVVVDSVPPIENKTLSTDEIIATQPSDPDNSNKQGFGDELLEGEVGSGGGDAFFLLEVMPAFKGGGLEKFREWIMRHAVYPQEAVDKKIRGTVVLSFVVEKDGSVSNVIILKGVNPLLDSEAVKAVSESPKWSPGLQRGQAVRVRYTIPVNFNFM
jgi:periplasmic protein TonB